MQSYISLQEGLMVTLVSMLVVFLVLILIMFLISLLKTIGKDEKENTKAQVDPKKDQSQAIDINEEELIAVISGAISHYYDGTNPPDYQIKSIKKIS